MAFTVLSYNIEEGGEGRLLSIVGVIRGRHPDAVALLETNRGADNDSLVFGPFDNKWRRGLRGGG